MVDAPSSASYPYLRNFIGLEVDEKSMQSVPHAKEELYVHVAYKTEQMGSILGGVIGSGVALFRKRPLSNSLVTGSKYGFLLGIPAGIIMTYMRMSKIEKAGNVDMNYAYYDRSYRLRHNRNQVRVDRAATGGFLVGAAVAVVKSSSILGGGAVGFAAGTIAGGVYNMAIAKSK